MLGYSISVSTHNLLYCTIFFAVENLGQAEFSWLDASLSPWRKRQTDRDKQKHTTRTRGINIATSWGKYNLIFYRHFTVGYKITTRTE